MEEAFCRMGRAVCWFSFIAFMLATVMSLDTRENISTW